MKVVVLTTSYPTPDHPAAGSFVASSVAAARNAGAEVDVVSPSSFAHFGVALGAGIAQNLRKEPWRLLGVPPFLAAFSIAARRAARAADLVHAHWIPSAIAARATGKPYVLQVWGTDVALAHRAPRVFRPLLRDARLVLAASSFLAGEARALGARHVEVVPVPVALPEDYPEPADPPHVLFAGRLSAEKGIMEFLTATDGLPRVVIGDGPLRDHAPDAAGFVPTSELAGYYGRSAVVCVPSRREGYGMTAREAMAFGRPVVATRVGGLAELGPGAVLVPPGDTDELRRAVTSLLADDARRATLGREAREEVASRWAPSVAGQALVAAWERALGHDR